ncbi:hypothetical protein GGR51DRAFT_529679 [Nemania sp. FL0031]|nr:hypothetical protein GGR51DRAFT_529679 [Nemania sp. FL0031]
MSRFPPCTRAQQGYSCYCPTCVMYNPGTAPRPELPQAGVSSSDRPPVYAGDTQTYSRGHDYGNDFSGSSVPMAPLGGSRLLGGHTGGNMDGLQPWAANPFSVINTGYQQPGPGSLGNFLDGARGSAGLDELSSQLGQQGNMATPELSPEPDAQPAKTRVKRKSKYNNEPPHSVYGPPFETKNITAGLSQDEIRARTQYNESVEEARKVYCKYFSGLFPSCFRNF